jgi:hypothetical protein
MGPQQSPDTRVEGADFEVVHPFNLQLPVLPRTVLFLILRCIDQNRCLFFVVRWSSDVVAFQLRRPE